MRNVAIFALAAAVLAAPDPAAVKVQGPDTFGTVVPIQIIQPGASGLTQTPLASSSTGAATALTATLTGAAAQTTYLTGFEVTGDGATAGTNIQVTITGTIGGTLNYTIEVPTGATASAQLVVEFTTPIPSSAVNTNIVVNVPSFGAGNLAASVVAHGYRQ